MIQNHSFSIVGGIQPDRLKSLLLKTGDDDGFMSRFLLFHPVRLPAGPIPPGADHSRMASAFERLFQLKKPEEGEFTTLLLSDAAMDAFNDWYVNERAGRHGTPGMIGSAYSKLPGYALRIAGLLHLLDWAFDGSEAQPDSHIQERQMVAALQLIESYFVPQILRTYGRAGESPVERFARAILDHCQTHMIQCFKVRDIARQWGLPGGRSKNASSQIGEAIQLLRKANWVKPGPGALGAKDFVVNPALFNEAMS